MPIEITEPFPKCAAISRRPKQQRNIVPVKYYTDNIGNIQRLFHVA